jgi:secreted trypsin-like serine protease
MKTIRAIIWTFVAVLFVSIIPHGAADATAAASASTTTTSSNRRSLIVGGHDVDAAIDNYDKKKYPGMVWSGVIGDGWGCGGAMIHPDFFVTAAHCQSAYKQQGGAYVGATHGDGSDGVYRHIQKLIPHPNHHHPDNDIMIVKLKPVKTRKNLDNDADNADDNNSAAAAPVAVFEMNRNPNFPVNGTSITSIGFGLTSEPNDDDDSDAELASILQEVEVDVWDFPSCLKTFQEYENVTLKEHTVLCMGTVDGGRDACDSDSGSPLLAWSAVAGPGRQQAPVLVGIINDGIGCGRPNTPAYNISIR